MQPIMEIAWDDEPTSRRRSRRLPVMSANFYPFTVFCWVLGVAMVGVVVACVCTQLMSAYTTLLAGLVG